MRGVDGSCEHHRPPVSGRAVTDTPSGGLLEPVIARASACLADALEMPVVDR